MRPTHKREGNLFTQSTDLNVNLIQNTLTETSRIMFDYINIWAPGGPMKLTWKISDHPFPTTFEDSYYYSPWYTALQPKHPRSSVIPHTAEFEAPVFWLCSCESQRTLFPAVPHPHSPVPKEEGCFFSSISPRVTRPHLSFWFYSPEALSGNYSWVCTQNKEPPQPPQATISLLVGCVC